MATSGDLTDNPSRLELNRTKRMKRTLTRYIDKFSSSKEIVTALTDPLIDTFRPLSFFWFVKDLDGELYDYPPPLTSDDIVKILAKITRLKTIYNNPNDYPFDNWETYFQTTKKLLKQTGSSDEDYAPHSEDLTGAEHFPVYSNESGGSYFHIFAETLAKLGDPQKAYGMIIDIGEMIIDIDDSEGIFDTDSCLKLLLSH